MHTAAVLVIRAETGVSAIVYRMNSAEGWLRGKLLR